MRLRLIRFLLTYAVLTVLLATQHLVFMACYASLFSGIGALDVLKVVSHGFPMDLSMAGYLTIVPGLLLVASAWTESRGWRIATRSWLAVTALAVSISQIADLMLYDYWGFRLDATPLFYLTTSPADAMASVSWWVVALGALGIAVYAAVIYKLLDWSMEFRFRRSSPLRRSTELPLGSALRRILISVTLLVLTALLFIPIRGGFTTATMNLSVAYFSQNQRLNHAAINPLFSFMYSVTHQSNFAEQYRYMDNSRATALLSQLVDRPVARHDSVPRIFRERRPDVIIVILESFSNHLMPSLGGEPIAERLDSLAREGITFTNFFGNSFRTDRGLVSIISGYPAQPSTSIMKYSEKVENLPSLSMAMRRAGYDLAYYYGGDANFTNMRAYLVSAGFDRIISDVDFPRGQRTGKWGVQDHLVFERLLADISAEKDKQPKLRIIQTSSSHEPFEVPYHKFDDIRKNAFAYTDKCLGDFVDSLRRMPRWNNTVVILVPDHQGAYPQHIDDVLARHRIPLVITGGAITGGRVIDTYASQIDIAATLLYQLGIDHSDLTFSKNILNPDTPHFAWFSEPSLFGFVSADNTFVYNCEANQVLVDDGERKGANADYGKAYLQKLYDDLDRR